MAVFREYAKTYDSFYSTKDYQGEVSYVLDLSREHAVAPASVLDMGCGTAGHLLPLAATVGHVSGFDRSPDMIAIARKKIQEAGLENRVTVEVGDLTSYRSGKTFELVVSMFAVMGYLVSNDALSAGLATARAHTARGGLFIFDVWAGSAVLHALPETRIQHFTLDGRPSLRLVTPHLDPSRQCVTIDYEILSFQGDRVASRITESHEMRYFFEQELAFFLSTAGFELIDVRPFMSPSRERTLDTWNLTFVARAV